MRRVPEAPYCSYLVRARRMSEFETEFEFLTALVGKPLAMPATSAAVIAALASVRLERGSVDELFAGPRAGRRPQAAGTTNQSAVARIPLFGIVDRRAPSWAWPDATNSSAFASVLSAAVADPKVSAIVIEIDSPGGAMDAAHELADAVFAARATKPVYALANASALGGAYWIGSQASAFLVTPSGQVGSIGVYTAHVDDSQAMARLGIATTLIAAGKYKVEGNPFEPLSVAGRAHLQREVDTAYDTMVNGIARGRGIAPNAVRDGFGEGRTLNAGPALRARMIDGIAALPKLMAAASKGASSATAALAATTRSALSALDGPRHAIDTAGARARHAMRTRELEILGGASLERDDESPVLH